MDIRDFAWPDYAGASALWRALGLLKPAIDSRAALAGCLARNPGLFLVGSAGEQVLATTLATFDGRRGYLYHVAVDPGHRRRGHGQAIVRATLDRLWARGAQKITLRVHRENQAAIAFYRALGLLPDLAVLGMSIEREG